PDYFEKLLNKFELDKNLGIAGGLIFELIDNSYIKQNINLNSVAGAVQLFRRKCYEDTGGYVPLIVGGIDTVAEVSARMNGWKTSTFPEIKVFHHRYVGVGTGSLFKSHFKNGIQNYSLGYHPLFQILFAIKHFNNKPLLITSILMLLGYIWAFLCNDTRQVSNKFVKYLRTEQMKRIGF
ncbi:glycosyltransferase family 2 protein, partial [Candidatus Latescibacterota bacterium]